jgi:hypothetical protein
MELAYPLELPLSVKQNLTDLVRLWGLQEFNMVFTQEADIIKETEGVITLQSKCRSPVAKLKLQDYMCYLQDLLSSVWRKQEYEHYNLYCPVYVKKKDGRWAPRGAAHPKKVMNFESGSWFESIGAAFGYDLELGQRFVGTAFTYHLAFECVVVGVPRASQSTLQPFIMFSCGHLHGVELVAFATAQPGGSQPYMLQLLINLPDAHAMLTDLKTDYATIGTLETKRYPPLADMFKRNNVVLRADNPRHAVEKVERMQPVYELLNGPVPYEWDFEVVWPIEDRVTFINSILNSSFHEARSECSQYLAPYWWPRYDATKDEYVGMMQGLLQLSATNASGEKVRLPVVACLQLDGADKFKVVTLLTLAQARTNALVYNPTSNFGQ